MKRILTTDYRDALEFLIEEFGVRTADNKLYLCNLLSCKDCLFEDTRDCEKVFEWLDKHNIKDYIEQIVREGSYDLAIQNNKVRYCRDVRDDDFCSSCMFYTEDGNCVQRRIDYLLEEV